MPILYFFLINVLYPTYVKKKVLNMRRRPRNYAIDDCHSNELSSNNTWSKCKLWRSQTSKWPFVSVHPVCSVNTDDMLNVGVFVMEFNLAYAYIGGFFHFQNMHVDVHIGQFRKICPQGHKQHTKTGSILSLIHL
jgi:hypothetical protein